jgi:hypothetical protein
VQADILTATTERIRPNKWAATALLARVYLFRGNWDAAVLAATTVIEHKELYDTVPLNTVFLKHSREAIWQLQPVDRTFTADAELFAVQRPVLISDDLLQAFEPDDARKQLWLGDNEQYYPYKYKVVTPGSPTTEYTMVLRLAEQYLIRAEAWARSGHPEEARADLNVIRQRAGLRDMGVTTTELLLATILHERRIEFFSEWGHRWLDLKRTGKVNAVMSGVTPGKGGSWQSYKQWYPIPRSELLLNHNLVQNTGY